ncbi:MAG: GNAT family N-acetyltransferase [Arachnia sp.]
MPEAVVRAYRADDRAAMGRICLLTGDSGGDATGKFSDDELLPAIYAYPYIDHAPELVRVVELDGDVVGYLVGVADVAAFSAWWGQHWAPRIQAWFPENAAWSGGERSLVERARNPLQEVPAWRSQYPAEFHIDLLPVAQGRGLGRLLIEDFRARLHSMGVHGLAIGVGASNTAAFGFYKRLGFKVLREHLDGDGNAVAHALWISTLTGVVHEEEADPAP